LIGIKGLLRRREEVWSRESIVGSREAGEYRKLEQGIMNNEGFRLEMRFLVRADLRPMEKNAQ
jgi:hypothetical protein